MMKLAKQMMVLVLVMGAAACAQLQGQANQGPDILDDRELIVLTADPVGTLVDAAQAKGYRLRAVHPLDALNDALVVFEIPQGQTIPGAIAEIEEALPEVTAGAHHLYRIQADEGGRNFAETMIAWPDNGCRAVHRVGMIDGGVGQAHPALREGRIVQERFVAGDGAPTTDHGALMADLLVGPGKLHGGRMFSANVVDPEIAGPSAGGVVSILQAMNWMRENDVDIVNISLAGPRNKLMNRALGEAAASGIVIVAAGGNAGPSSAPLYPAAFPFTIAVTAVDTNKVLYESAVRGEHIDIAAPGVDVLVRSETGLHVASGTSVAAPFVTAVLAANPTLSMGDIDAVKAQLARDALDLGPSGRDVMYGAGLITADFACRP